MTCKLKFGKNLVCQVINRALKMLLLFKLFKNKNGPYSLIPKTKLAIILRKWKIRTRFKYCAQHKRDLFANLKQQFALVYLYYSMV